MASKALVTTEQVDWRDALRHSVKRALQMTGAVILLGAMLFQVSLGLFAGDPYDGMTGPLNPLVGVALADTITEIHETFFWVVAGLIGLHLAAISFYAMRGDDLLSPMVGGSRPPMGGVDGIGPTPWGRGLLAVALTAALALWVAFGVPPLA